MTICADAPLTLSDIARTPRVLDSLAARAPELVDFTRRHLTPDPGGRLLVYGCGDGLVAAEAVAGGLVVARTALDMLAYEAPRLTPADRVLAVSMSGNVDRGVEAAEIVQDRKAGLAVLTNTDGGRLGRLGTPTFPLSIPPIKPFLAGTATYSGTLFALMTVAAILSDAPLPVTPSRAIEGLAVGMAAQLDTLPSEITGVRFLSAGLNRATAAHASAKLVELTRLPSWHDDIEEFAHSQFWSADPGELIVYIATNPIVAKLADHSARVLGEMGFMTLAIAPASLAVTGAAQTLVLPDTSEALSLLPAATAVQVLAWHLSRVTGLDPDTRAHLKDDTFRFATSRRLTRRTLVGTGR